MSERVGERMSEVDERRLKGLLDKEKKTRIRIEIDNKYGWMDEPPGFMDGEKMKVKSGMNVRTCK